MRHPPSLTLAAVLLSFACGSTPRAGSSAAAPAADARTAVALPADGHQAVLREMRQMLAAMGGAMDAAARRDTTALVTAIAPARSAAAADPALEALLPAEWKELAERTHTAFDSLAVSVGRTPARQLGDTVLVRLARVTASCAACHETYRLRSS